MEGAHLNHLRAEIFRRNRESSESWQRYAPHRKRVTQILVEAGKNAASVATGATLAPGAFGSATVAAPTLCVLGAGNLNDLDLAQLTAFFASVHLVDLDGEALRDGLARQASQQTLDPAALARIASRGDVDTSGVLERIDGWRPETPPDADSLEMALDAAATAPPPLGERFTVVSSVCLLSQLVFTALSALGGGHSRFADFVAALRRRHLQMLLDMTLPGGAAVLIHDFVSSDSLPQMTEISAEQFPAAMQKVAQTANVFFGLSPYRIEYLLRTDPALAGRTASRHWSPAWRWDFGPRSYAVTAVTMTLPK